MAGSVPAQSAGAVTARSAARVAAAATANLITNGNFESPATGFAEFGAGDTSMPGWTVEAGTVDLVQSDWIAQDGSQSLDLAGSNPGSVQQAVSTTAGRAYALTWWLAGNTNCGNTIKTLQVSWNGKVITSPVFDTTGHSNASMGWTQQEIYVTAAGTSSTVRFGDATQQGDTRCGAAIDNSALVPATIAKPAFTRASPLLKTLTGTSYSAAFFATGVPSYSLAGAPAWLSVDSYGAVTGTPPTGTTSFSYSVKAFNADGSVTAGPYTVAVVAGAPVSGTVTDGGIASTPVSGAIVQACVTGGGECQKTTTAADGTYSVPAPIGATVVVSAFPLAGSGDVTTSTNPLTVPASGITGETISLDGIAPLPNGMTVNGTTAPTVYWANPATVSTTGCKDGLSMTSVIGQNTQTGQYDVRQLLLDESPAGSGSYTGTIPPLEPIHGPVWIDNSVSCPPQSAILPNAGPAGGGTSVVVAGSGFTGATGVTFGGAPARSFSVDEDQEIEAVAPAGTGTVDVAVVNGGKSTVVGQYTYMAVNSVSPASGAAAGGTTVAITGAGLGSAEAVYFGTSAAAFTQVSDTEIDAISPPGTGTVDITVHTLGSQATGTSTADRFTYDATAAAAHRIPRPPAAPSALSAAALGASHSAGSQQGQPLSWFPSCSSSNNLVRAELDCLSDVVKSSKFNWADAVVAAAEAHRTPTCANRASATSAAIQALLQPLIGTLVTGAQLTFVPLFLSTVGPILYQYGGYKLVAQATVLAYFYISYVIQANAGIIISNHVNSWYDSHGCPVGPPNGLIDPSGTVLSTNGQPVKGATVSILRADTAAGPFTPEPPVSADIDPNVNPETTGADGVFHWDVVAGWYEISATAAGCTAPGNPLQSTVTIGPYPVPPPQLGLTITLACTGPPPPAPKVSSLSVATGGTPGGTQLTVLGSGFTPASKATFGKGAARSVTFLSSQALAVTSPAGSGLVDIRVQTQGGTSAVGPADKFFFGSAPAVSKVSPSSGPGTGGTAVTITGTGLTGASAVTFGGLPAASVSVKSSTSLQAVAPAGLSGTVDVQVINPAGVSAVVKADKFSYHAVTAYVVTAAGVLPVNAVTGQAGRVITVPGASQVAVARNGKAAYVVSRALGTVTPVTVTTGKAGRAIAVGKQPDAIAITPNSATAYVANGGSGTVTPIAVATGRAGRAIAVGKQPDAIAITPNGATAYVANGGSGTVTPIAVATGKAGQAIKVGGHPDAIAITPNGKTAFVASTTGTVTPIIISTGKTGQAIRAGTDPVALAISLSGSTLYVASYGTAAAHGSTVVPVQVSTGKAGKAITVGSGPDAIAITPGGLFALVANFYSGTVSPIRLSTGAVGIAITVGSKPTSIAMTP
jgi:choice-of-anchor C domain-containing protein